jgi:hypothetical protein
MDQEQPVSADFKGGAGGRIKVSFNLEITKADGSVEVRPVTGYLPEQVQEDLNG